MGATPVRKERKRAKENGWVTGAKPTARQGGKISEPQRVKLGMQRCLQLSLRPKNSAFRIGPCNGNGYVTSFSSVAVGRVLTFRRSREWVQCPARYPGAGYCKRASVL